MTSPIPQHLPMRDAEVTFYPQFFDTDESDRLFDQLMREINWKQEAARFGGKSVPLPRLTAWYGDVGKSYRYSGITVQPTVWTPTLLMIKEGAH